MNRLLALIARAKLALLHEEFRVKVAQQHTHHTPRGLHEQRQSLPTV